MNRFELDVAKKLALFAAQRSWTSTDLWNQYEQNKHEFSKSEQIQMYRITARASAFLAISDAISRGE